MFQLEYVNPSLRVPFLYGPVRFLPNPLDKSGGLEGIKLGKFFSRVFDVKGMVKKAPRIIAGAASGYVMGGGFGGAAAGAVTAAAFKRRAGTSVFQDIYRGGLYGMIGGTAVGVGKVAMGKSQEAGLVGKGYEYVNKKFFAPVPPMQGPIRPTSLPIPPMQGPMLPAKTETGSNWEKGYELTKEVLPGTLSFGEKTLDYMTAYQQQKAAQYVAASADVVRQEAANVGPYNMGVPGFGYPGLNYPPGEGGGFITPGGMPFGGGVPSGVSSDVSQGIPIGSVGIPTEEGLIPEEELPITKRWWFIPTLITVSGVFLLGIYYNR